MTQPPQPHPQDANPYAQQPPQEQQPQPGYGYPQQQQQPYAPFPQQQQPMGFPPAPPQVPARGNPGLGVLAGFVTMLVAAGAYGGLIGGIEREIGYAAVGVGFLVGFATGKVGGRHPATPVVAAALSLVGVYFGQLLGEAIIGSKQLPVTVSELFFEHFSLLNEAWKADSDFLSVVFFAVAAVASFGAAKRAAG
jgi:XapX domain-containing protein